MTARSEHDGREKRRDNSASPAPGGRPATPYEFVLGPTRWPWKKAFLTAFLLIAVQGWLGTGFIFAQHPHAAPPHPPASHPSQHSGGQPRPAGQQHLNEWIQHNRSLSPQQQAQRLRQEPGFQNLPPQQQQRLTNRLQQLNNMPADQRQRTLERVENMERLSPGQQQQVRGSAARLGQMPHDRQLAVKDAMRNLRNVPPAQRPSALNSSQYDHLTPEERGVVSDLLTVEPYHAAPAPQQ